MASGEEILGSIIQGLLQGAGTEAKKKTSTTTISKVKKYKAADVKRIRNGTGYSIKNFAGYIGVTEAVLKEWESGVSEPTGPAARILQMIDMDAETITRYPFVKKKGSSSASSKKTGTSTTSSKKKTGTSSTSSKKKTSTSSKKKTGTRSMPELEPEEGEGEE